MINLLSKGKKVSFFKKHNVAQIPFSSPFSSFFEMQEKFSKRP